MEKKRRRRKRRKIFGEGIFLEEKNNRDGKRGKYLEKEKMFFVEEKKENIMETLHWRGKNYCGQVDGRTGQRLKKKSSRI